MTAVENALLDMSAREVIGTRIKFLSPKSMRVRRGIVRGISATGVRIVTPTGDPFILLWSEILEITK
jgi:hypothetical protein